MKKADMAIIIPSLQPDERLLTLLKDIRSKEEEYHPIVLINDGSDESYNPYFLAAQDQYGVHLLQHDLNFGKGQALKTAFNFLASYPRPLLGAVTIDSDGQHTYEDMMKCIQTFKNNSQAFIFGVRVFTQDHVPMRSKFGNLLTSKMLSATTGMNLSDTQTGLRIIPKDHFTNMVSLDGDRFEYEMNMIYYIQENNLPLVEVPIETIYIDENQSSHFNALMDSALIYQKFIKYVLISILSFLIDISLFSLILYALPSTGTLAITTATVLARFVSSLFNYLTTRYFIFKTGTSTSPIKFAVLTVFQSVVSGWLVSGLSFIGPTRNIAALKIIVDLILFFISYIIQKKFIFNDS